MSLTKSESCVSPGNKLAVGRQEASSRSEAGQRAFSRIRSTLITSKSSSGGSSTGSRRSSANRRLEHGKRPADVVVVNVRSDQVMKETLRARVSTPSTAVSTVNFSNNHADDDVLHRTKIAKCLSSSCMQTPDHATTP